MDRHVKVPKDKVAFLEFVELVFDISIILEDKLEGGLRTFLHVISMELYRVCYG